MSTSLESNFIQPVVAMIVYALITLIVSFLNTKFVKLRPILSGKTLILYDNGTLFKENFKKAEIDLNEFLVQCGVRIDIWTHLMRGCIMKLCTLI